MSCEPGFDIPAEAVIPYPLRRAGFPLSREGQVTGDLGGSVVQLFPGHNTSVFEQLRQRGQFVS